MWAVRLLWFFRVILMSMFVTSFAQLPSLVFGSFEDLLLQHSFHLLPAP